MASQEEPAAATSAHNQEALNAFQRMKELAHGMSAAQATRTARRLSKWANPNHAQWKEINKEVSKDMIRAIWPCEDGEIKKGRWKVSKCRHLEIKDNAERIYLEVFGHPLHNADCPLYFAKMLFVQFVQQRPVDFSSKETTVATHDLRENCVTFTREELALIVEGADLQLKRREDTFTSKEDTFTNRLAEKDAEIARLMNVAQASPALQARMEQGMNRLSQDIQGLTDRVNPTPTNPVHISHLIVHPDYVPASAEEATGSAQCPVCTKVFDGWSGSYFLACGHFYHLICLIRLMQNNTQCAICSADIPQGLYYMFGMANDYKSKHTRRGPTGASRNLFQDATSDNQPPC